MDEGSGKHINWPIRADRKRNIRDWRTKGLENRRHYTGMGGDSGQGWYIIFIFMKIESLKMNSD